MFLADRTQPDNGITPGLMPSIHDGEPPMPARTQKYVPPAQADLPGFAPAVGWVRLAMLLATFVILLWDAVPEWVYPVFPLAMWAIPDRVLQRLIPKPRRQQPTVIQGDSGDIWITDVPSILVEDAIRSNVRLPFRVMSGLIALASMILAMALDDGGSLLVRITYFLVGMIFGGIALVPGGDLRRILPRLSTAPRLPAPGGDADAG